MKIMFVSMAVLALVGCTTVNDLRNTKPVITGHSSKSVQVFTECILNKWNDHTYLQPVLEQSLPEGNSFQFNDPWRGPVFIFDVRKSNDGSDFKLYRSREISFYEDAIIFCK